MADAEYFIQLFLFGATLFCYILLLLFIIYGAYYCCLRSCLKVRRRRQQERKLELDMEAESNMSSYRAQIQLINPFQSNNKATIVSNSNTSPSRQDSTNITHSDLNSNTEPVPPESSANHFVDKKYYDIFMA